MKKLILLAVTSLGVFALAGCGKTAEKANTEAPKEVNSDKIFKVNELVEKVKADKDTWKGKEVGVTGIITMRSSVTVLLVNKKWDKEVVSCVIQALPKQELDETIEVKGKISELITQGDSTAVKLEPCEIKK